MRGCARCYKNRPADELVHSAFTGLYYCRDFDPCDRRMNRRVRENARRELEKIGVTVPDDLRRARGARGAMQDRAQRPELFDLNPEVI